MSVYCFVDADGNGIGLAGEGLSIIPTHGHLIIDHMRCYVSGQAFPNIMRIANQSVVCVSFLMEECALWVVGIGAYNAFHFSASLEATCIDDRPPCGIVVSLRPLARILALTAKKTVEIETTEDTLFIHIVDDAQRRVVSYNILYFVDREPERPIRYPCVSLGMLAASAGEIQGAVDFMCASTSNPERTPLFIECIPPNAFRFSVETAQASAALDIIHGEHYLQRSRKKCESGVQVVSFQYHRLAVTLAEVDVILRHIEHLRGPDDSVSMSIVRFDAAAIQSEEQLDTREADLLHLMLTFPIRTGTRHAGNGIVIISPIVTHDGESE